MNTSMSSRRVDFRVVEDEASDFAAVLAFVAGVILIGMGVKLSSAVLAIPGFVLSCGVFMKWNALFWASRIDRKRRK